MKGTELPIAVVDIFAIVLPGAVFLLIWCPLLPAPVDQISKSIFLEGNAFINFLSFVLFSYLFGTAIYSISSLLDEYFYWPIYINKWQKNNSSFWERLRLAAERVHVMPVDKFFKETRNTERFQRLIMFYLRDKHSSLVTELDHIEGPQKMFRSLCIAFIFSSPFVSLSALTAYFSKNPVVPAVVPSLLAGLTLRSILLVLGLVALWRYAFLRRRHLERALELFVVAWDLAGQPAARSDDDQAPLVDVVAPVEHGRRALG